MCGGHNSNEDTQCGSCIELRDQGILGADAIGVRPESTCVAEDVSWSCPICSTPNAQQNQLCSICMFDKHSSSTLGTPCAAGGSPPGASSSTWECLCSSQVPLATHVCHVCSSWRCDACTSINCETNAMCSVCANALPAGADTSSPMGPAQPSPAPAATAAGTGASAAAAATAHPQHAYTSDQEAFLPPLPVALPLHRQCTEEQAAARRNAYAEPHGPGLPKLLQQEESDLRSAAENTLAVVPGAHFIHDAHAASDAVLGGAVQHDLAQRGTLLLWRRPKRIAEVVNGCLQTMQLDETAGDSSHGSWRLLHGSKLQADDVRQGQLGNCYALASLFIVAECDRSAAERLFQSVETSAVGLYQVRLCLGGLWASVPVDDLLPTHHERAYLVFAHAARRQLWVSLVEKAMASVSLRGYSGLAAGHIQEGLRLLTGAPVLQVFLANGQTHEEWLLSASRDAVPAAVSDASVRDDLWVRLLSYSSAGFAMGASCGLHSAGPTHAHPEIHHALLTSGLACDNYGSIQALGLIPNHAYALTRVFEMPAVSAADAEPRWRHQTRFVQIRNPHGRCAYSGPWHFGSALWSSYLKEIAGVPSEAEMRAAGVAILPFEIFLKCFNTLAVAKVRPASAGYSRLAASILLPDLSLQHRLRHCSAHTTLTAADGALPHLWSDALGASYLPPVPGVCVQTHSSGSCDIVLSRPPQRFAWPAAAASTDPLRAPLQGAFHKNDLAFAVFEGDLSCTPPLPLAQLSLVTVSPRSSWEHTITAEAHLAAGRTYSIIPFSFAALSMSLDAAARGAKPWESSSSAAAQRGGARAEIAFTTGHKGALDEPPAACIEVHTAAATLVHAASFSVAVLRRCTIAAVLAQGQVGLAFDTAGELQIMQWQSREAGKIMVAVNRSYDKVLTVRLDWAPKPAAEAGGTAGLVSTRGGSGVSSDTLLPRTAQIITVLSVAQSAEESAASGAGGGADSKGGWSVAYSSQFSVQSVHSVQSGQAQLHTAWPPVQGTIHEPEPLD